MQMQSVENLPDFGITMKYRTQLPFCVSLWKKYLKNKIKELQSQLTAITKAKRKINNLLATKVPPHERWKYEAVAEIFCYDDLPKLQKELKSLSFRVDLLNGKANLNKGISEVQLQQAKAVPLENLYNGQLRKSGQTLIGACPFHKDNTPSFVIYMKTNSFYCFAEGIGGDIITYIMKKQNLDFQATIKFLLYDQRA